MSVDMQMFQGFAEQIKTLGDKAVLPELSDEERIDKVKGVFFEKIDKVTALGLESCVHCGMCATACHFYVTTEDPKYVPAYKLDLIKRFYRRELSPLRWLHKLYTKDITVKDLEDWQELVYDSCTECLRCSVICPMGINIAGMVNTTRQAFSAAGMVPAELMAVAQEQSYTDNVCGYGSLFGVGTSEMRSTIKSLQDEGLEIPLDKEKAEVMVLTTVVDLMLFGDALKATVKIMNKLGMDWTFRSCAFEGANFGLLSGDENLQSFASNQVVKEAIDCGAKTVIVPECGHAYPALRWEGANEYGEPLPFTVLAISEFVGREIQDGNLKVNPIGKDKKITYHDPCKIGRWGGVLEEPRAVFNALDVDFTEMESNGVTNWCCGGGAGVFLLNRAAPLRAKAFGIKMQQVEATGSDSIVTSCGSCRLNFLGGKMNVGWDKDIESLVELVADNLAD